MRPIDKGSAPQVNGITKTVTDYKDWRLDLINIIGNFCSYCNMVLNDSPQVEHVVPKNPQPGNIAGSLTDWNNMLLACGPCNRAKSNKPISINTHFIPDYHNTHLAFEYLIINPSLNNKLSFPACIPIPNSDARVNQQKAKDTIALLDLSNIKKDPSATDLRWKFRYEALVLARLWKSNWDDWGKNIGSQFIDLLISATTSKGFFSIWFNVFSDVPEVKSALIKAFPGTHIRSFDSNNFFHPIVRVKNDL